MTTCAASAESAQVAGHVHTCSGCTGPNHFCPDCRRWWWS